MANSPQANAWPLALRLAGLWLIFVVWSSCAGWILSWLGHLHGIGYLIATFPLALALKAVWRASAGCSPPNNNPWSAFRQPAALSWLGIMLLCLIGGVIHPPSNYDALSYRLPRILYWWQNQGWFWIQGADGRMNYSGTGFEWQMLPLLILFRSDRVLFLLNWLPFLLFPFMAYHALRELGVGNRMASRWMWPLTLAYGFALQASSIGNDLMGGIFVVATLAFCRLAKNNSSRLALGLAMLAASSVTALKGSNLPLLLPLGIACLHAFWHLRPLWRPAWLAASVLPILLSSFIPTAVTNYHHTGDWTGDPLNSSRLQITRPLPGLTGNSINLALGSIQPPVLPLTPALKKKILAPLEKEDSLGGYIRTGFPRFAFLIGGEIPGEEGAGIGLAVTLLLTMCLLRGKRGPKPQPQAWLLGLSSAAAITAYMLKMGSENTARLMLPYTPLAIGSLLALVPKAYPHSRGIRHAFCWLPAICLLPALLLNPNRPLLPLRNLSELGFLPENISSRIAAIHAGYSSRNEPLAALRHDLPAECTVLGFAGGPTRSAYSLFKPFGDRKIVEVTSGNWDDFEWIAASEQGITSRLGRKWEEWLEESPYDIVSRHVVIFYTRAGPETWYLLKKRDMR